MNEPKATTNSAPAVSKLGLVAMDLSPAEANLIKRARLLTQGEHLVILDIDAAGLRSVIFLAEGKREWLRPVQLKLPIIKGA